MWPHKNNDVPCRVLPTPKGEFHPNYDFLLFPRWCLGKNIFSITAIKMMLLTSTGSLYWTSLRHLVQILTCLKAFWAGISSLKAGIRKTTRHTGHKHTQTFIKSHSNKHQYYKGCFNQFCSHSTAENTISVAMACNCTCHVVAFTDKHNSTLKCLCL